MTSTHLFEWLKYKTQTIINADEEAEQKKLPLLAIGMQNDTSSLEDSLVVSYEFEHRLIWPSNCTLM